jgi:hypothetical protein
MTVRADKPLDVSALVVPKTVLFDTFRVAKLAVRNDNWRDGNLVFFSYLFPELDGKLHSVDMLTANMSELVVWTGTSPFIRYKDNVIVSFAGLGMHMVVIIGNSNEIGFECYLFSFFLSWVICYHLPISIPTTLFKHVGNK